LFIVGCQVLLGLSFASESWGDEEITTNADSKQLLEPLTVPNQTQLPYKYVGNNFSGKFHRPSCKFARAMNVDHVIFFHFRQDAISAGQQPCRYCLPPVWLTVKAKILGAKEEEPLPLHAVSDTNASK
jgi:hypothetical protein